MPRFFLCFCCVFGVSLSFASAVCAVASPAIYRVALLVGHNDAGGRVPSLKFAVSDAQKMRDVLTQVSGYRPQHIWMLRNPQPIRVLGAFAAIKRHIAAVRKRPNPPKTILLLVYFSGHAKHGKFLMGKSELRFDALRRFLRSAGADLRLAILDACESGGLTLIRGLKRRKDSFRVPFLNLTPTTKGEVIITAAGARESAHEDPLLRGGIFTHYLVTGLRGAADRDKDGHVTLEEAYRYSYARSLERTIFSAHGPQRAHFRKQLSGFGQLVLSTIQRPKALLHLRRGLRGNFFIWNQRQDMLLAELNKRKGRATVVALQPGRYILQWRRRGGVYATKIQLKQGQRLQLGSIKARLAYRKIGVRRGGAGLSGKFSSAGLRASGETMLRWEVFRGQMLGTSLAINYQSSWSGLVPGLWQQGPSAALSLPLSWGGEERFGFLSRLAYQVGTRQESRQFGYGLHLLHLDLGVVYHLLRRRQWLWSVGLRLRGTPMLQNIWSRPSREGEELVSLSGGAGALTHLQIGFGTRWFVNVDLDVGVQVVPLADAWSWQWAVSTAVGVGIRL